VATATQLERSHDLVSTRRTRQVDSVLNADFAVHSSAREQSDSQDVRWVAQPALSTPAAYTGYESADFCQIWRSFSTSQTAPDSSQAIVGAVQSLFGEWQRTDSSPASERDKYAYN
jgi:hypothetical protein